MYNLGNADDLPDSDRTLDCQIDPDANESEGSIFEEMMGDFSSFEGDDNYSDDD